MIRPSNYDKWPVIDIPNSSGTACRGWDSISAELLNAIRRAGSGATIVVAIECYTGVFDREISKALHSRLNPALWIDTADLLLSPDEIDRLVAPDLGGDDPIFGRLSQLTLDRFFSPDLISSCRKRIAITNGLVIVCGTGASLVVPEPTVFVYADLTRWEAQLRQRRNEISNLGVANRNLKASLQYKRSFFIDWRVCDRLKQKTMFRWNFVLDTCAKDDPKMVPGDMFRAAMAHCVTRPFRVVPFFDPGPWGGQWMKQVCDLDRSEPNFAWCFDCVPEENSLLLNFGDVRIEIPAINLVFAQPRALLGEPVYDRFGPEFPIRFDFLDTMDGGNLSFQVHPLTPYIQEHFGMRYTQDESYYMLDAGPDAVVYLGRKTGTNMNDMIADLEAAQRGDKAFDDERFVARFPAKKHDHFLIPAGTLHCSGRNGMVLEISATPYIFTFKLWDWGRMGLDGKPRPINIEHGRRNILWDRDEEYARSRLVNQVRELSRGDGWREERTGLHEAEFIETRRHWFTKPVPHDTGGEQAGGVNVLNLVEGNEAVVESREGAFAPFIVHYAETFIVPAFVGQYQIRPLNGGSTASENATIKAFVRSPAQDFAGATCTSTRRQQKGRNP